jgi:peptide/nickel transport system permease protein
MSRTQRATAWHRFKRQKIAGAGVILVLTLTTTGIVAPKFIPCDPFAQTLSQRYQPPSRSHLLGTDQFGRDLLNRMIVGSRISLGIGLVVTVMALAIGTMLGAVAGYFGGKLDTLIMRWVDLLLAFPLIYLLVAGVAFFGAEWIILILVMAATSWMDIARLVRAEIMSLKERDFIKAAEVLGLGRARIIFRHLLPNALAPVIAAAALRMADVMLIESSLSFLGLGVQPPAVSWGSIIRDGRDVLTTAWWIVSFPGLAIALTTMSLNWIGEGMRKAMAL